MRAGIYARVSGRGQALYGTSLREQVAACKRYVRDQRGRVVDVYQDAGVSGTLLDRPGITRAIADAKAGKFDALVFYDLDRLARDLLVQENIVADLRAADVEIYSLNQPNLEGDDPSRKLIRQVFGSIAEYQKSMTVARLRLGREAIRAAGGHAEGAPRFGWKVVNGALMPDPDEQAAVALIRRLRRSGKSYREICAELNRRGGLRTRKGGPWLPNTVRRIYGYGNQPYQGFKSRKQAS